MFRFNDQFQVSQFTDTLIRSIKIKDTFLAQLQKDKTQDFSRASDKTLPSPSQPQRQTQDQRKNQDKSPTKSKTEDEQSILQEELPSAKYVSSINIIGMTSDGVIADVIIDFNTLETKQDKDQSLKTELVIWCRREHNLLLSVFSPPQFVTNADLSIDEKLLIFTTKAIVDGKKGTNVYAILTDSLENKQKLIHSHQGTIKILFASKRDTKYYYLLYREGKSGFIDFCSCKATRTREGKLELRSNPVCEKALCKNCIWCRLSRAAETTTNETGGFLTTLLARGLEGQVVKCSWIAKRQDANNTHTLVVSEVAKNAVTVLYEIPFVLPLPANVEIAPALPFPFPVYGTDESKEEQTFVRLFEFGGAPVLCTCHTGTETLDVNVLLFYTRHSVSFSYPLSVLPNHAPPHTLFTMFDDTLAVFLPSVALCLLSVAPPCRPRVLLAAEGDAAKLSAFSFSTPGRFSPLWWWDGATCNGNSNDSITASNITSNSNNAGSAGNDSGNNNSDKLYGRGIVEQVEVIVETGNEQKKNTDAKPEEKVVGEHEPQQAADAPPTEKNKAQGSELLYDYSTGFIGRLVFNKKSLETLFLEEKSPRVRKNLLNVGVTCMRDKDCVSRMLSSMFQKCPQNAHVNLLTELIQCSAAAELSQQRQSIADFDKVELALPRTTLSELSQKELQSSLRSAKVAVTSPSPTTFALGTKMSVKTLCDAEFSAERSAYLKKERNEKDLSIETALRLHFDGLNNKIGDTAALAKRVVDTWDDVATKLYCLVFDAHPPFIHAGAQDTHEAGTFWVAAEHRPFTTPIKLTKPQRVQAEKYLNLLQNYHNALENMYLTPPQEFDVLFSIICSLCLPSSLFLQHMEHGLVKVTPIFAEFLLATSASLPLLIRILSALPRDKTLLILSRYPELQPHVLHYVVAANPQLVQAQPNEFSDSLAADSPFQPLTLFTEVYRSHLRSFATSELCNTLLDYLENADCPESLKENCIDKTQQQQQQQ